LLLSREPWFTDRLGCLRNCTLLFVFLETGIHASALCALRLRDVDRKSGSLSVGQGSKERWIILGSNGWFHLLCYLE
jgi:site-specific recombinase XerD